MGMLLVTLLAPVAIGCGDDVDEPVDDTPVDAGRVRKPTDAGRMDGPAKSLEGEMKNSREDNSDDEDNITIVIVDPTGGTKTGGSVGSGSNGGRTDAGQGETTDGGRHTDSGLEGGEEGGDRSDAAADAATDSATPNPAPPIVPTCDVNEAPLAPAIFVSKFVTCGTGTAANPTCTIAAAVKRAMDTKVQRIYVDVDVYEESISIPSSITIEGGWRFINGTWERDCTNPHPEVRSPSNVGIRVAAGEVVLRHLSVFTANGGTQSNGEGQSTYGVWASGESTHVQLFDTDITAGNGGNGAEATGSVPGEPSVCPATIGCEGSSRGTDGQQGRPAEHGGFTGEGYVAGPAEPGRPGARGQNGAAPPPAPTRPDCVSCQFKTGSTGFGGCAVEHKSMTGHAGTCGCGGSGGAGGGAGHSGGASIGLLLTGGAHVSIEAANVYSANGGNGTDGAQGAHGSAGSRGGAGAISSCAADCSMAGGSACVSTATKTISGGDPGGTGGDGGAGGRGGSGRGGPSFAIVALKGSTVAGLKRGRYAAGAGGIGGSGNVIGEANPLRIEQ